jgi:hypothetical protein
VEGQGDRICNVQESQQGAAWVNDPRAGYAITLKLLIYVDARDEDTTTRLLATCLRSGIATHGLSGPFVSYSKRHAGFIDRDYDMG